MVYVKLLGGLGNQMFQYAVGRHLSIKNSDSLMLDLTDLLKREDIDYTPREFELDIFDVKYTGKILASERRTFKERFALKYLTRRVDEIDYIFDPEVLGLKGNLYLNGFWQNEKYFNGIEDIIRQDFTLKAKVLPLNDLTVKKISSINSVSVHFRRGDYLSNPTAKNIHGVVEVGYYKKALTKISELVESPHFFIFSDDIDWVRENFVFEQEHTFISHDACAAYDMHLMSLCKHNITANSSFSWWGAWLNRNPDKIVISPQQWINAIQTEIVPEHWMKF